MLSFEATPKKGCDEEMVLTHPSQAKDRKPLAKTSNYLPPKEEYPSTCPNKDAQRIGNLELKRIDPTLQSRRSEHGDEDDTLMGDGIPKEMDMQIE